MATLAARGKLPGASASRLDSAPLAISRPSAALSPHSSRLSTSSRRTSRPRLAPSAARTAISLERDTARASSRFATFAQAISSRKPTAASKDSSAGRTGRTTASIKGISLTAQPRLVGCNLGGPLGDRVHLLLRLRQRDPRLQPAEHLQPVPEVVLPGGVPEALGREHLHLLVVDEPVAVRDLRPDRQHAHHAHRLAVQLDGLSDDLRPPAELPAPEAVAQDDDAARLHVPVLGQEVAAEQRLDPQRRQGLERDGQPLQSPGLAAGLERPATSGGRGQALKAGRAAPANRETSRTAP